MPDRLLLVTADDFGIGPETSRGILEGAGRGVITSTVLLVNSPHAVDAVNAWNAAGQKLELGWHPCLTLDCPILPAAHVPSLVDHDGRFLTLGRFLQRIVFGQINREEVRAELQAQLWRYLDLVGRPPINVNAHHHVHIFRAVLEPLMEVLQPIKPRPYLRRVQECVSTLRAVPGARLKRSFLSWRGRQAADSQSTAGFSGNHSLIGVTDPQHVSDPEFFTRWLQASRGNPVELACHPGHVDSTLDGRDTDAHERRRHELTLLLSPNFLSTVRELGFRLVSASEMMESGIRNFPSAGRCSRLKTGVQRRRMKIPPCSSGPGFWI